MRAALRSLFSAVALMTLVVANSPLAQALPLGIGTLDVWLDAHDPTTLFSDTAGTIAAPDGGAVRRWADKSGNSRHAIADSINSPIRDDFELNTRPAVQFGTTGQSLDITGISFTNDYTIFAVDEYTGGTNGRSINSETTNLLIGKWNNQNSYYNNAGFVDSNVDGMQGAVTNVPIIATAIANSGTNRSFYHRNGRDVTSGTPSSGTGPGTLEIGPGSGPGGGEASNFAIGEFAAYAGQLNAAQVIIVENYLSSKHSVALNTGGGAVDVYAGDTVGNGEYDFGVLGIGQDATGSQETGTLSEGLGISEANTSLANNEWLMAGHDGTVNSIVTLEGTDPFAQEPTTGDRWDRVWYVDKTGALDATLSFDFEDSGLATPAPGDTFHLLYSADNDFSDGWDVLAQTSLIASGTVSFTVLDGNLLDGYYTLGVNIVSVPEPSTAMILLLGSAGFVWQGRRRQVGRRIG